MIKSFATMMRAAPFRICALTAAMLFVSCSSQALTLGRIRGAAIIAQPLSLSISVSAAVDEDVRDICFEADVLYGDNKVDASRVTLTPESPAAGKSWQVRIESRLPVDEPVVTVDLKSSCGAKTSRRYVLLADVAPETVVVAPLASQGAAARAELTAERPVAAGLPADLKLPGAVPAAVPAAKRSKSAQGLQGGGASTLSKADGASKSRLKLAPLDLSPERDPVLRVTPELTSSPSDDPQKRGEAAALWRSLNLSPEDVLRDAARLQGLERDVKMLIGASGQNQRQLADLTARLERAESDSSWSAWALGLAALLALVAGGAVWWFRRQHQTESRHLPWWRSASAGAGAAADSRLEIEADVDAFIASTTSQPAPAVANPRPDPVAPVRSPAPGAVLPAAQSHVAAQEAAQDVDIDLDLDMDLDLDLDLDLGDEIGVGGGVDAGVVEVPAPLPQAQHASGVAGQRDFSSSLNSTLRAINTQEMLDTRQQAEFFMALGQYDSAIEMLRAHIADAEDLNPSIYLDLLEIYHTLSRKDDFDRCRDEFQVIFTGRVPHYAEFQRRGETLDAFPELCNHLVKLWPSREALDFLASCLVRHPDAAARMEFDLEAFKELLMLHGVAGRLVHALGGVAVGLGARKPTELQGADFQTGPMPLDISSPVSTTPPLDIDVGLDIPADQAPVNLIDFDVSGLEKGPKS